MRGLSKSFGPVRAVHEVNLEIARGELVAVLGPSGCGKTTLLRLIAGFERPDAGCVVVAGEVVAGPGRMVPPEKRQVGMVFQDYALFPHLTRARRTSPSGSSPRPREERERITRRTLELVGLQHKAERTRTSCRAASASAWRWRARWRPSPELVLLDEPFSSLDATLRAGLRREVELILRDAGATALLVTHDQEEALSLADRLAVMREGRIVQVGAAGRGLRRAGQALGRAVRGRGERAGRRGPRQRAWRPSSASSTWARRPRARCTWRCGPSSSSCARDGAATPRWSRASSAATTCSTACATRAGRTLLVQLPSLELHEVGDEVFVRPAPAARTCALVD